MTNSRPAIGISSCLLGENVRYDGGHKRNAFITDVLSEHFQFRPVCPEVAIGLGTPRPPIHLHEDERIIRVIGVKEPDKDFTGALREYGRRMSEELAEISGYIFKAKSPSCGVWRVPIHRESKPPVKDGRGAYADAFIQARPLLPVEEEGRLHDPVLRENFIERVFAFRRWQELVMKGVTADRLVKFHTAHKLTLMSHDAEAMRELGRLVANAERTDLHALAHDYIARFMKVLEKRATRRRHADVLMHLMGFLKKVIDGDDKRELLDVIHAYRRGELPLIVPVTLLKHHFRRHPRPYTAEQVYLNPHPRELMLRNNL